MTSVKYRLDQYLVMNGFCESRSLAQDMIREGLVSINGKTIMKNSFTVNGKEEIKVMTKAISFASRAGFKLYGALCDFGIDLTDRVVADVGASTGGFTDVCLKAGAKHVYAIDVGSDQLIERLKHDVRVTNMEHTNCRYLEASMFDQQPDFACMDVSFISIKLILPALVEVLGHEKEMLLLIKPQFEAGRNDIGKNGIVKNRKVHQRVLSELMTFVESLGLHVHHLDVSSIEGRDGNREYVMHVSIRESRQVFDLANITTKQIENRW